MLINLTPHDINFVSDSGTTTIPTSGLVRVEMDSRLRFEISEVSELSELSIGVYRNTYSSPVGIPEEAFKTREVKTSSCPHCYCDFYDHRSHCDCGNILVNHPAVTVYGTQDRYIVSSLALQAIKEHHPEIAHLFFIPNDTVRNESGAIIGCRSLAQ